MAGENIEKINGKAPLSETGKKVSVFGTYRYHVKRSYFFKIRRVATRDIVPLWVRVSLFFIKILVSGQENIACDKLTKYHNLTVIRL